MKKSIALFFIAIIAFANASQVTQFMNTDTTEIITTTKRILQFETELLKNSTVIPIWYVENLISLNKENLALVKDDFIQSNLMMLDNDLEEALEALHALRELRDNHTETPRQKIKLVNALEKANNELAIIDYMLDTSKI